MSAFDQLIARAQQQPARIVLPEATDERMLEAAAMAANDGRCVPVLVGKESAIKAAASDNNQSIDKIEIIDIDNSSSRDSLIDTLVERRKHKGMTADKAAQALADPLVHACTAVSAGLADGCVAGAVYPTADVTRTALQIVGAAPGASFVSSFFLMVMKHDFQPLSGVTVFADCALVVDPDAEQLSEIALQTAQSTQALMGVDPVVAMLSFSTNGSANHPHVTKVQDATHMTEKLFNEQSGGWQVIGDVQLDAAVMPEILQKKAPEFSKNLIRAGETNQSLPNILIFPSLEAGNIGYKLCERFGGCDAVGPVLQGLARPVNDLSRGCKTEDISRILAITSLQAGVGPS